MTTKQVTLIAAVTSLVTVVLVAVLLWVAGVAAGPLASNGGSVPRLINYQGRLTDAAGNPLTGSYNMTFRLYTGGAVCWTEAQTVNVTYGVLNVLLGNVTPIPPNCFTSPNLELGVRVGSDSEMTPRRRVVSAGYAYKAEEAVDADTLDGSHASAFASTSHGHASLDAADGDPQRALLVDNDGNIGIGTMNPARKLEVNGDALIKGALTIQSTVVPGGVASHPVYYPLGISINAGHYGRTYLLLASEHWTDGNATHSAMYLIRCGYSGNYFQSFYIGGSGDFVMFQADANGILNAASVYGTVLAIIANKE
jgi:hypothetical protein